MRHSSRRPTVMRRAASGWRRRCWTRLPRSAECSNQQLRVVRERPRRDPLQPKRDEYRGYETRLLAMLQKREQHGAR